MGKSTPNPAEPLYLEEVPVTLWSEISLVATGLHYAFAKGSTIGAAGMPVELLRGASGVEADWLLVLDCLDVRVPAKAIIGPKTSLSTMAWVQVGEKEYGEAPIAAMPVVFGPVGGLTVPAGTMFRVGLRIAEPAEASALVILRGRAGRPIS